MKKEYIYRTDDSYEFNTLKEALKHAELHEECSSVTQYNIFSEDDYEEPKQVWVRESRLIEGTSNFGWVDPLPLLVFYTDDEVYSMMEYDDENPRNHYDDYETEDAYYDAVEKYEDEYWNKIDICVLSEDDVNRLDKALDDLNDELKSLSDDFYDQAYELETDEGYEENKEEVDHLYDQSSILEDVAAFKIEPGYYSAAYIDCKYNKEIKDLDKEYQDMIFNKIKEIKKEFGLTEMEVAWGPASNGETGYRKVESLKEEENKKETIYYCLSDKKMPKHSILLYGEEGRDKLLEIAPKYLEYYGQAEIFKSVNGNKTTIWEDGKLVEEESVEEVVEESKKRKKERVRFVGNPEKEMAFFNHAMGSDVGVSMGESKEESLKESRDEERVAHYQKLLDELYVTPEETELILKTADEYEENAHKGWITFDEADEVTEKLNLKNLSPMDLSRMWEVVYYTLSKEAFTEGKDYEKYSDVASAFAEVINMEARKRKEQIDKDSNLEAIVGDRFVIDDDGLLYLTTSAMKDLVAWAKRRGKTIDDLMSLSITKSKDGRTGTLNLKDYSIQFKKLWN